jgi:hypothetical protein
LVATGKRVPVRRGGESLSGKNHAIHVDGANSNTVRVNLIGTDAIGMNAGNRDGVMINGGRDNRIADNVISGNEGTGVTVVVLPTAHTM